MTNPEKHIIIFSPKAVTRDTKPDGVFQRAIHFGESIVLRNLVLPPFSFFGATTEDGLPVTGTRDEIFLNHGWNRDKLCLLPRADLFQYGVAFLEDDYEETAPKE